jgi:hypothetical protein
MVKFNEYEREICGNFPSGYQMCTIIDADGDWLKFRTKDGREAWAKHNLGHCCERERAQTGERE